MKTIFKYLFASILVGLCAMLYQTVLHSPNTRLFSSRIPSDQQVIEETTHTKSSKNKAFARAARYAQLEQEAFADELEIPVSYEMVDQPVGHIPLPKADEKKVLIDSQLPTEKQTSLPSFLSNGSYNQSGNQSGELQKPETSNNQHYLNNQNYYDMPHHYPDYYPGHSPSSSVSAGHGMNEPAGQSSPSSQTWQQVQPTKDEKAEHESKDNNDMRLGSHFGKNRTNAVRSEMNVPSTEQEEEKEEEEEEPVAPPQPKKLSLLGRLGKVVEAGASTLWKLLGGTFLSYICKEIYKKLFGPSKPEVVKAMADLAESVSDDSNLTKGAALATVPVAVVAGKKFMNHKGSSTPSTPPTPPTSKPSESAPKIVDSQPAQKLDDAAKQAKIGPKKSNRLITESNISAPSLRSEPLVFNSEFIPVQGSQTTNLIEEADRARVKHELSSMPSTDQVQRKKLLPTQNELLPMTSAEVIEPVTIEILWPETSTQASTLEQSPASQNTQVRKASNVSMPSFAEIGGPVHVQGPRLGESTLTLDSSELMQPNVQAEQRLNSQPVVKPQRKLLGQGHGAPEMIDPITIEILLPETITQASTLSKPTLSEPTLSEPVRQVRSERKTSNADMLNVSKTGPEHVQGPQLPETTLTVDSTQQLMQLEQSPIQTAENIKVRVKVDRRVLQQLPKNYKDLTIIIDPQTDTQEVWKLFQAFRQSGIIYPALSTTPEIEALANSYRINMSLLSKEFARLQDVSVPSQRLSQGRVNKLGQRSETIRPEDVEILPPVQDYQVAEDYEALTNKGKAITATAIVVKIFGSSLLGYLLEITPLLTYAYQGYQAHQADQSIDRTAIEFGKRLAESNPVSLPANSESTALEPASYQKFLEQVLKLPSSVKVIR